MADEITLDAPETRLERFLAAAAGVEGITLDEPETRIEKYLYKIAQGSGGVPPVEDADKGKYLHANESTGDLEWATAGGSGGGGVLVVGMTVDGNTATLDKTWQEIVDADLAVVKEEYDTGASIDTLSAYGIGEGTYWVNFGGHDGELPDFEASSASGYPSATLNFGG